MENSLGHCHGSLFLPPALQSPKFHLTNNLSSISNFGFSHGKSLKMAAFSPLDTDTRRLKLVLKGITMDSVP